MKNRRISITSSIIEGIERMVQSNCIDESYAEFILDWIQNIKRFPMQKYSDIPKELRLKLEILNAQYVDKNEEKNGLVYHKSVLDAFMYIDKVNERYGKVASIAVEVESAPRPLECVASFVGRKGMDTVECAAGNEPRQIKLVSIVRD